MYEFASSPDGRYYASLKNNLLTCCYEGSLFWKEELPYADNRLLCIGNNANIITLSDDSIVLIIPEKKAKHKIIEGLRKQDLLEEKAIITALYINEIGTQLCVGKRYLKPGIKNKIKNFFSIQGGENGETEHHTIDFISLIAEKRKNYFAGDFDGGTQHKFCWSISRDFAWIVLAEPVKTITGVTTKINLVNVMEFTTYAEHKIQGSIVKSVMANKEGAVIADTIYKDINIIEVFFQNGVNRQLVYDSGWVIKYLGRDFIAFKTADNRIVAKTFEDQLLCDASFTPLEEMGVPYFVHFMEKNNINIIEAMNDELKIVRTSVDLINTDSKRWSFIQRSMSEQKQQQQQQQTEQSAREMLYQRKKAELAATINQKPLENTETGPEEPRLVKTVINPERPVISEPAVIPSLSSAETAIDPQPAAMPSLPSAETAIDPQPADKEKFAAIQSLSSAETAIDPQPLIKPAVIKADTQDTEPEKPKPDGYISKEIAEQLFYNEELSIPVKTLDMLDLYNAKDKTAEELQEHTVKPIIAKVKSLELDSTSRSGGKAKKQPSFASLDDDPLLKKTSSFASPEEDPLQDVLNRNIAKVESRQNEKQKIMKLIEMLDERFIHGEVTEAVYKELKTKYMRKIKSMGNE